MRPIAEKLGIRSGEGRLVAVSAFTLGAVVAENVVVTAAATGLVLGAYGGRVLPVLYAVGALFSIVLSLLASAVVGRLSRFAETAGTLLVFALLLGLGRLGLAFEARVVSLVLHPIALTVSVLLIGQTYTLIGDRLDSGQAKRLLPSIGAGSTAGALLASGCLLGLSSRLGAANLVLLGMGLGLAASLGASRLARRLSTAPLQRRTPSLRAPGALWPRVRLWLGDSLFRSLSLFVLATTVGTTLFRFSFEAELGRALGPSQIAATIGGLNLAVNLVVLLIHGLVESRLIQAFGFRPGLLSLPLVLGVGGVLWLVSPGLWVATGTRFLDSTLRFSLARSSEELLLIPLPSVVRRRLRLLTAGAIAPVATVATSALLGVMGIRAVGILAVAAGIVGVLAALLTFRPYLRQLRTAMADHRLKLFAPSASLSPLGSEVHGMIEEGLESASPDDMCFSLRLAAESGLVLGPELLDQCLLHPQPHVRRAALSVAAERADGITKVRRLLERESEPSVAAAAIRVLASRGTSEDKGLLERFLTDRRPELRFVALAAAKGEGALPALVQALGEGRKGRLASDALSLCPPVATATALVEALAGSSGQRRKDVVRALDRLSEAGGELSPHREPLIAALRRELRFLVLSRLLRAAAGAPPLVLREAELAERHAEDGVIRMVALLVSERELRRACLSYASGDRRLRALSLELLGALLPARLRSLVIPLLEEVPLVTLVDRARERFSMPYDVETDFATLLGDSDEIELRWLALALLSETPKGPLEERMLPLLGELTSLRRVEIFSRLAPEELLPIAEITREIEVPAGSVLFSQGEAGGEFFIVLSGTLLVERHGRLISELGPHSCFGETALLGRGRRTATIRTKTDCLLSVISSGDFEDLLDVHPSIARGMLTVLAQRFDSVPPAL